MNDMMTFPNTWEEFERVYGITDREEIYTNGARLIPSFRVKQWLDHIAELEKNTDKRAETHACVLIDRQAAVDEIDEWIKAFRENGHKESAADARLIKDGIIQLPPAQPEQQWISFTLRPLTADEKEENPDWDCILVGRLPDDGQMILVTINIVGHESVQCDTYYDDDGSYLESGYEIGTEATAWMPLPEPYKGS